MANFNFYCGIFSVILGLIFWFRLPRGTVKGYFTRSREHESPRFSILLAWGVFAVCSNIGLSAIFTRFFQTELPAKPDTLANIMSDTLGKLIVFPLVLLVVPIFEEILFRGFIFDGFKGFKKNQNLIPILGSAFLFSFCHGQNQMLGAFSFAFGLSQLKIQTKNLRFNFLTHASNNAFGLVALLCHLPTLSYPTSTAIFVLAMGSGFYAHFASPPTLALP